LCSIRFEDTLEKIKPGEERPTASPRLGGDEGRRHTPEKGIRERYRAHKEKSDYGTEGKQMGGGPLRIQWAMKGNIEEGEALN